LHGTRPFQGASTPPQKRDALREKVPLGGGGRSHQKLTIRNRGGAEVESVRPEVWEASNAKEINGGRTGNTDREGERVLRLKAEKRQRISQQSDRLEMGVRNERPPPRKKRELKEGGVRMFLRQGNKARKSHPEKKGGWLVIM